MKPAALMLAAGAGGLLLLLGGKKASAATDGAEAEVPDSVLERVVAAIQTDDPKKMRAEAKLLRKEGYEPQAAALEQAAQQVEQRKAEQGSSAIGAPRVLRAGMSGDDVRDWQKLLQRDGHAEVVADGAFGSITTSATKAWQRARGLPADGVVGPATRAAIGTAPSSPAPSSAAPSSPAPAPAVTISVPGLPTVTLPVPAPSSAPAPAPATRLLKEGSKGDDVKAWQNELRRAGYSQVKADGVYGPVTTAATKAYQAERGLKADGVVGPATRGATGSAPIGAKPAAAAPAPSSAPAAAPALQIKPETWRTMRRGTSGADVGELQQYLNAYAGAKLTVDRKYGPATETAVKAWQLTQGLVADGVLGPAGRTRIASHLQRGSAVAGELADPEPAPDVVELGTRLATHLRQVTPGHEDRALVVSFQRALGLNASGAYGPGTAEALVSLGLVPPRPFYWPQKGASSARARYRATLRQQAASDPERRGALLALL